MKPKIICHIMSSVDGRLIDGRWTAPYEAEYGDLLKVYASIGRELNTDAWMFGKKYNPRHIYLPIRYCRAYHIIR